jgi:hypothetical protein
MSDTGRTFKRKSKIPTEICEETCSNNLPLYVGASALLISVVTSVFFYKEFKKIKRDIGDIKQIKNQLSNVDIRFESIESNLDEITKFIKSRKQPTNVIPPRKIVYQEKKENHLKIPTPVYEEEEESDCDDEIEVESVDEN